LKFAEIANTEVGAVKGRHKKEILLHYWGPANSAARGDFALLVLALDLKTVSCYSPYLEVIVANEKSSHQDQSLHAIDCHVRKIIVPLENFRSKYETLLKE